MKKIGCTKVIATLIFLSSSWSFAQLESATQSPSASPSSQGTQSGTVQPKRRVDVDKLKKQYWTQSGEFDVVQNRLYSKSGKFELTGYFGSVATDPFLSVRNGGGSFGYYLDETFSFRLLAWKYFVSDSQAKETILRENNVIPNDNIPNVFYGGEFRASIIYGKLSLLGKAILYYDLQVALGAGLVDTETGKNFAQMGGLGQKIFLSQTFSIDLEYRLMRYTETIINKGTTPNASLPADRTNWSNIIMLGIGAMF